jgi:hypothetical protein
MLAPWSHYAVGSVEALSAVGVIEERVDSPQDNNDGRLGVRDQTKALIDHKTRCEDRGKVEDLKYKL